MPAGPDVANVSGRAVDGRRFLNLVVLVGTLASPPRRRLLPSGDGLVEYEVTVRRPGERAETVPVVWPSAPAEALEHPSDSGVIVVGRVRRRFFRAAGATASRTEVMAERVLVAAGSSGPGRAGKQARAARALLAAAADQLAAAGG